MKTNLTLICLLDNYAKNVSKILCDELEMFYANIDELVEYELGDAQHILSTLGNENGQKYILECEERVIKNASGFENSIISVNPTTMFSNDNFEVLANSSYVIYLQISPKFFEARAKYSGDNVAKDINDICFTDRDKLYVEKSDIVINCSKFKEQKTAKKLIRQITKFFKKLIKAQKLNPEE